jgi:hypothetical protein
MPLEVPEDLWSCALNYIRTAAVWASWLDVTLEPFNTGREILYDVFSIKLEFQTWLWCKTSWSHILLTNHWFVSLMVLKNINVGHLNVETWFSQFQAFANCSHYLWQPRWQWQKWHVVGISITTNPSGPLLLCGVNVIHTSQRWNDLQWQYCWKEYSSVVMTSAVII